MKLEGRRQEGRGDLVVQVQRGVYQGAREFLHRWVKLGSRVRHVLLQDLPVYRRERLGLWKTKSKLRESMPCCDGSSIKME